MQETQIQSRGWDDPSEEGMATQSSILVWRIPWTEKPGGLQSMGSQRIGHNWSDWAHPLCICQSQSPDLSLSLVTFYSDIVPSLENKNCKNGVRNICKLLPRFADSWDFIDTSFTVLPSPPLSLSVSVCLLSVYLPFLSLCLYAPIPAQGRPSMLPLQVQCTHSSDCMLSSSAVLKTVRQEPWV